MLFGTRMTRMQGNADLGGFFLWGFLNRIENSPYGNLESRYASSNKFIKLVVAVTFLPLSSEYFVIFNFP